MSNMYTTKLPAIAPPAIDRLPEGVKYDQGKVRYDLIDAYALDELAKVYTMGAKKYEDENWRKGMQWSRIFGALMRHSWKFWRARMLGTSEIDEESGLPHLAHAAWCCFTLLWYSKYRQEFDNRPVSPDAN